MTGLMCLKELMLTNFLEINFGFQPELCEGCHDLMQKAMSFNNVAIVSKFIFGT